LERNRLKGVAGNAVNAVLAAAAMNFQNLMRAIQRARVSEIYAILSQLLFQGNFSDSGWSLQAA
jgi:hypothetical protein